MPELAAESVGRKPSRAPLSQLVKKRWRAWLRAVHRDVGYVAVGFTVIYALSGIAMNHIDDWDPNFHATEKTLAIQPITDEMTDDEAVARITTAAGLSRPDQVLRAGDELRLEYENGTKVTAIGETVTVQARSSRFFFRVANWLHATRGKQAWKYISDVYAALLLYLAISGIFMIKGRLGLRWRGSMLIAVGLAAPVAYIVLSGGPGAQKPETKVAGTAPAEDSGIRFLTPEENGDTGETGEDGETPSRAPIERPPSRTDAPAPERPPVRKQPPAER